MQVPKRKLPPPLVLRRHLLEEGMTYSEIAARYKCHKQTVPVTVRNDARRLGLPEKPIGVGTKEHTIRIVRGRMKVRAVKCVERSPLRDVLRDFVKRNPDFTLHRVAELAGLSRSWVWEVSRENSRRPYVSRTYAMRLTKVMDLIDLGRGALEVEHTEGDDCAGCDTVAEAKAKLIAMGVWPWMTPPSLNINRRPNIARALSR